MNERHIWPSVEAAMREAFNPHMLGYEMVRQVAYLAAHEAVRRTTEEARSNQVVKP